MVAIEYYGSNDDVSGPQTCPHLPKDREYLYIQMDEGTTKGEAKLTLAERVVGSVLTPGVDPMPDWDTLHKCAPHPLKPQSFWTVAIEKS